MRTLLALLALGILAGCEPKLPTQPEADAGLDAGVDAGPAKFTTTTMNGVNVSVIDAIQGDQFTAVDLDTATQVTFEPPAWDLAFQRFQVRARGGASGDGGVEVAPILDAGFDQVTQAPATGFLVDQPDGPDSNSDVDTVFSTVVPWYLYDPSNHTLSPGTNVYVVKSDRGAFFKVQIEKYYDGAGTPAVLTVRWAKLP